MSDRDAFHKDRLTGIGGSDAAAVLGLSPWKSALELYREKRGEAPAFTGNEATRWGTLLEPVVRQEYAERTGRVVRVPEGVLRHQDRAYMIAHPDGLTDCGRLYEGKTARSGEGWGEPGSDVIPMGYLLQVQHYMVVTALPVADVAVLIGGQDFRIYEIPADRELQQMMADAEGEFWSKVLAGVAPEPDWQDPRALEVVRSLYTGTNGLTVTASPALAEWKRVHDAAKEKVATYQSAADAALAHMLYEMGEAAVLSFPDGKALRRKITKKKGYAVEPSEYLDTRFVNAKD